MEMCVLLDGSLEMPLWALTLWRVKSGLEVSEIVSEMIMLILYDDKSWYIWRWLDKSKLICIELN